MRAFDDHKQDPRESLFANRDLVEIKAAIEELGGELSDTQQAKYERAMKPTDAWVHE
jgi:hypothetical protein